jgi:hypothetical protein
MGCGEGFFFGVEVDCLRITEKDRQVLVCHRKEEAAESERASENRTGIIAQQIRKN